MFSKGNVGWMVALTACSICPSLAQSSPAPRSSVQAAGQVVPSGRVQANGSRAAVSPETASRRAADLAPCAQSKSLPSGSNHVSAPANVTAEAIQKANAQGLSLICQGQYKEAEALFKALKTHAPANPAILSNHALALMGLRSYEEALDEYTEAISIAPRRADFYVNRGDVFKALGFSKRATADYTKAIELEPRIASGYRSRALVYTANREFQKSIADYTQLIAVDPERAVTYLQQRAFCWKATGTNAKALQDVNAAIKLAPELPANYLDRGALLLEAGNESGARSDYDKAVALNPRSVQVLLSRAACLVQMKQFGLALRDCDDAAKINPTIAEATALLSLSASALNGAGKYDQAVGLASRAIDLTPLASKPYLIRAEAQFRLQQYGPALQDCDRLISMKASEPEAYALRAQIMDKLAARDRALAQKSKPLL